MLFLKQISYTLYESIKWSNPLENAFQLLILFPPIRKLVSIEILYNEERFLYDTLLLFGGGVDGSCKRSSIGRCSDVWPKWDASMLLGIHNVSNAIISLLQQGETTQIMLLSIQK